VTVELEGHPLLMTAATMTVACETLDGSAPEDLIAKTASTTTVANSIRKGIPVTILTQPPSGAAM
jgi:organic hydroperoxide reductase OsmC/OhrA